MVKMEDKEGRKLPRKPVGSLVLEGERSKVKGERKVWMREMKRKGRKGEGG